MPLWWLDVAFLGGAPLPSSPEEEEGEGQRRARRCRAGETKAGMCFAVRTRPRIGLNGSVGCERGEDAELAAPGSVPGAGSGRRVSFYVAAEQAMIIAYKGQLG